MSHPPALLIAQSAKAPGCPRRGTRFSRALARGLLRLGGWRVESRLPDEPRFVLIVAPHTSNRDFIVGVLAMFAVGLRLNWLGKHTVFRFPVAGILRWLGGEAVDRRSHHGLVEAAIERFQARAQWVLGITPEGTRKRVDRWKTGFYQIAVGAGVPILPVTFDYSRKVVDLGTLYRPTGDPDADFRSLHRLYRKGMARHPEGFAEEEESVPPSFLHP